MAHIDTLLLLALPASGKSEIRRYLYHLDPATRLNDLGIGNIVELDDYPYVRLMILVDLESVAAGEETVFFQEPGGLLRDGRDWGTLAALLAEDYARLGTKLQPSDRPLLAFLERYDRARGATGVPPVTSLIPPDLMPRLGAALDQECADLEQIMIRAAGQWNEAATVVVEFARGGPEGSDLPLTDPHGYQYTLPFLGEDLLGRASILYVWATPEESRRRNLERANPGGEADATVLHHSAPEIVMRKDYGIDDLPWLIEQGNGTVAVEIDDSSFSLDAGVIDNRRDATSFLRADPSTWADRDVADLHTRLVAAMAPLR